MEIRNLQFFDSNGYNLNFDWNENGYWEGNIYLPKVSVGIYANTSIYILEKLDSSSVETYQNQYFDVRVDSSLFDNKYFFPTGSGKIEFHWDKVNKFVDEFFMFDFDESYVMQETSALVYTPNDGPECNTLIINRFDTYDITLDNTLSSKALPVHIAFMANEKYDATTYNRTLIMSHNGKTIARIKFYAETIEEDERLKVWNANLGYNITPEDEMIFYKSDIKEYMPNYETLNEKRKELMMEGSNIYPYIGSYKAIINAIKFFGYDNLNIIEYWRNVNPDDVNFGKIYHSSKYSLTKKETLTIGSRNITLPNKDYKKINALALVYSINKPTGQIDEFELPLMKEQFTYTIEEALIKLFALRKKLNKEFMPGSSRIIDIIGEGNYFGLQGITKVKDEQHIDFFEKQRYVDFSVEPSKYAHITDNEYFNRYINTIKNYTDGTPIPLRDQLLSDMMDTNLNSIRNDRGYYDENNHRIPEMIELKELNNNTKCELFRNYHQDAFVDYTLYKDIEDNDDYPFDNPEYQYTSVYDRFSAKVILNNISFEEVTFDNCDLKFDCSYNVYELDDDGHILNYELDDNGHVLNRTTKEHYIDGNNNPITFNNVDLLHRPDLITWKIKMSDNQVDDDLKKAGIDKEYTKYNLDALENPYNMKYTKTREFVYGDYSYNQFFVELPYVGYYDVTMTLSYSNKPDTYNITKTKTRCIKVEPYQIELKGFYYDARKLPTDLQYENEEGSEMYNFIHKSLTNMIGWAVAEKTAVDNPIEYSMPTYSTDGSVINPGPYFNNNIINEWYLSDNITYDIAELKPIVKYARYIKSGVDVKPYTWFLLGFDYTKIAGKINPVWTIKNNSTGEESDYEGLYFTFLLTREGNYTITLRLEDKLGNKYEVVRNIIVVGKSANYKLYQTFKKDYDYVQEQNMLIELNKLNEFYIRD